MSTACVPPFKSMLCWGTRLRTPTVDSHYCYTVLMPPFLSRCILYRINLIRVISVSTDLFGPILELCSACFRHSSGVQCFTQNVIACRV